MTIAQMTRALRASEMTARDLTLGYLARIRENAHLHAVIQVNPDAMGLAEGLDACGNKLGALHGVPLLIKDNISTGDAMATSAGSLVLAGNMAPHDAPVAARLRRAGAVLLGKANMTEFANYMAGDMPNGYSSRGGQTLNFFDAAADPSGSSTGSAVAVAAGLCAAAIGTETWGSIISPAKRAGIVGLKPTAGLVPNQGILPISPTLDTAGPMARYVEDAAMLLGVMAEKTYLAAPSAPLRIGVCRNFVADTDPEVVAAGESVIAALRGEGLPVTELPDHELKAEFTPTIMLHEFAAGVANYLAEMANPELPQTLGDIIAHNRRTPGALVYGQDILERAATCAGLDAPEYRAALEQREEAIAAFDAYFDDNGVDVILMLAAGCSLAPATGFPALTLPIGKTEKGLPIGCYLVARRHAEEALLRMGLAVEGPVLLF